MQLDLYQLRTFFTAAQTLNYTEAAARLYITQSAVSHAISKLERTAGARLLERSGRKCRLTEAGRKLYGACEKIFYELERAGDAIAAGKSRPETIRLGATVEFGTTLLIKHMRDFLRRNPDLHVDFYFSHELLKPLLSDELDLVVDCRDHKVPGLLKRPLFREEYAVVASPEIAARLREPADLSGANVLSLDKAGAWWNNFLDALPAASRPVFGRVTQVSHIRGIVNAAAESIGVGFVPKYCVLKELKAGTLRHVFPRLRLLEDNFSVYQKENRAGLERHRRLETYLLGLRGGRGPGALKPHGG